MKLSVISLALLMGLTACVSDDAVGVVSSPVSVSTEGTGEDSATTSPETSTTLATTELSTDEPTDLTAGEAPDSNVGAIGDQEPKVSARRQGKPITVTTAGPEVLSKSTVGSNVKLKREWCEVSETGALLALAEVQNTGGLEGDFILEFEVINPLGVRVAEGLDVVHDVKAGQNFIGRETLIDVVGWEGDARSWTCQVLRLSTPEAVLQ